MRELWCRVLPLAAPFSALRATKIAVNPVIPIYREKVIPCDFIELRLWQWICFVL